MLFRRLPADRGTLTGICTPLPGRHLRLCDLRRVRLPCAGLCHHLSRKARCGRRAAVLICRLLSSARMCPVLDLLPAPEHHADQGFCQGAHTLSAVGLHLLRTVWYADRYAPECFRQPAFCQRPVMRMDRLRQSLDVRRPADHGEKGRKHRRINLPQRSHLWSLFPSL